MCVFIVCAASMAIFNGLTAQMIFRCVAVTAAENRREGEIQCDVKHQSHE